MSHRSVIRRFPIKSLPAFEAACERLGMKFLRDASRYKTHEGHRACSHAAQAHVGGRQVGLVLLPDGGWQLEYDPYGAQGTRLESVAGRELAKLRQVYAEEAVREAYATTAPGETPWQIERETLPDGSVRLVMTR